MKVNLTKPCITIVALVLCHVSLHAQVEDRITYGFGYSQGSANRSFVQNNYNYSFIGYRFHLNYTFLRKRNWNFEVNAEPSYYRSEFWKNSENDDYQAINEYVLNLGLITELEIKKGLRLYLQCSSGPEFIDQSTYRQSRGLSFSNLLSLGIRLDWDAVILDFRTGIRHVSNAGMRNPNGGYNSTLTGLNILFRKKPRINRGTFVGNIPF